MQGEAGEDGVEVPHGALVAVGESGGGGDRLPSYLPSVSINQILYIAIIV